MQGRKSKNRRTGWKRWWAGTDKFPPTISTQPCVIPARDCLGHSFPPHLTQDAGAGQPSVGLMFQHADPLQTLLDNHSDTPLPREKKPLFRACRPITGTKIRHRKSKTLITSQSPCDSELHFHADTHIPGQFGRSCILQLLVYRKLTTRAYGYQCLFQARRIHSSNLFQYNWAVTRFPS